MDIRLAVYVSTVHSICILFILKTSEKRGPHFGLFASTLSTGEGSILEMRSQWFLSGRSTITMQTSSVQRRLLSRGKMQLFVSFNTSIYQLSVSSLLGASFNTSLLMSFLVFNLYFF